MFGRWWAADECPHERGRDCSSKMRWIWPYLTPAFKRLNVETERGSGLVWMWYIPIPYINLFFIIYSPPPTPPPLLPSLLLPLSTAGSFIVLLKSEREMTEKCIRPLLHFNINTGGVINIEAESIQERSDYKTLHCLIYGRQQQGSKVRFLPFSLCFITQKRLSAHLFSTMQTCTKKVLKKVIRPFRVREWFILYLDEWW